MSDFFEASEEKIPQASFEIYNWAAAVLGAPRKEPENVLRASAAPQCVRKRWYKAHGYKGEPMQPRSLLVFALGDMVEHVMKYLIKQACVGKDKLYSEVDFGKKTGTFIIQHREFEIYEQDEVKLLPNTKYEVIGHPDGWGKRNSDGEWELIEVKSASDFGYRDFVRGETPDYIKQVHALMASDKGLDLNCHSARFFYMAKNTSHIHDRLFIQDLEITTEVITEYSISLGDEIPNRPYGFDSKGKLDWHCSYCELLNLCRPNLEKTFKNGKPTYKEKI